MTIFRHRVRRLLRNLGYDVRKFTPASHPLARTKRLLESYRIDTILDVGANTGEFAIQMRHGIGYTGNILSFEPLSSAYSVLNANAKMDPHWQAYNLALGDTDELRNINIAGNSVSSSLVEMLPRHIEIEPSSRYIATEEIQVRRLDSIFDGLCAAANRIYLKIDTQGFEQRVLSGAKASIRRVGTVQMELSLVPLYEGEVLFDEMCRLMVEKGYSLYSVDTAFADENTGQMLQADCIFHRL